MIPSALTTEFEKSTHMYIRTFRHRRGLVRQAESAAHSGLSVVLFGGLCMSQALPQSATVLWLKQHTDPSTVSSPRHISETHTRSPTHTQILHGLWTLVFVLVCLFMSVILCVCVSVGCVVVHGLVDMCQTTQKYLCSMPFAIQSRYSHHPLTVTNQ